MVFNLEERCHIADSLSHSTAQTFSTRHPVRAEEQILAVPNSEPKLRLS